MSAINSTAIATFFGSDDSLDHIRSDCSTKYHLKHRDPYVPRQGRYGTISEACLKSNCRFIIKSLPLATDIQRKVFQKEVLISRAIGKAGIGPEVHDVFICMNSGFIVMERWDGDYRSLVKKDDKYKEDDLRAIAYLVQKLHRLGIIHNDLHLGNLVWDGESLHMIDFAELKTVDELIEDYLMRKKQNPEETARKRDIEKLYHIVRNIARSKYMKKNHPTLLRYWLMSTPEDPRDLETYYSRLEALPV